MNACVQKFEPKETSEVDHSLTEQIIVCRLHSCSAFTVTCIVQATPVTAIVDSAAEVTVISDKVYNKLKPKPPVKKHAILHTAGRDMSMKGFIVGPVNVQLGSLTFEVALDSILDDPHINKISSSEESSVPKQDIPDHLKILWEQSKKHITAEEQTKLRRLLYEYQDVFARNEFDLGNFTAIEHNIDTGDAKPLK